jgi:hypothetical protein
VPLYATLPSVQEILLVDSERVVAELLRRNADWTWPADTSTIDPVAGIHLTTIDMILPLPQVYSGTTLAAEAARLAKSPDGLPPSR